MVRLPRSSRLLLALALVSGGSPAGAGRISSATQDCIDCHRSVTPGIVADWEASRHAKLTVAEALDPARKPLERRISITAAPAEIARYVVGCAECHTANAAKHKDTFLHGDQHVHVVVTPQDCATCHPVETEQYGKNIMSRAHTNLKNNPLFHSMLTSANGTDVLEAGKLVSKPGNALTEDESCYGCHGSKIEVEGFRDRETSSGKMSFPVLKGWPNQGVGRVNPDGSEGSCTACHARHAFSLELARSPETCSQCHSAPDAPAYRVYRTSKHGNIFDVLGKTFNMDAVPWTVGKDFTAPTCATCHISQIVSKSSKVLVERTHQMNDRLPWRLFGLPYAHPHPLDPDTSIIRNKAGLTLPTELSGEPASKYLIDEKEIAARKQRMMSVCLSCHSSGLVETHFARLENTIRTTNALTRTATQLMEKIWGAGLADRSNLFDEAIERRWVDSWLMYANSIRLGSAMMSAEYGVFTNGRWEATRAIRELSDWLEDHLKSGAKPAKKN